MRILALMLMTTGCLELLETECDQYVDYLCTCGAADCDSLRETFSGAGPAIQEQCRIEQSCFESADGQAGETCSIVGTDDEDTCLES
ncbi:MAG: hypothetical protein AB8H79_03880 [Myxococcota bacterium]